MHADDDTSGWHLGALKSMSVRLKKGRCWAGAGISYLFSRDVRTWGVITNTQWRIAPMCEEVSANLVRQVQCATLTEPLVLMITHGLRGDLLAESYASLYPKQQPFLPHSTSSIVFQVPTHWWSICNFGGSWSSSSVTKLVVCNTYMTIYG